METPSFKNLIRGVANFEISSAIAISITVYLAGSVASIAMFTLPSEVDLALANTLAIDHSVALRQPQDQNRVLGLETSSIITYISPSNGSSFVYDGIGAKFEIETNTTAACTYLNTQSEVPVPMKTDEIGLNHSALFAVQPGEIYEVRFSCTATDPVTGNDTISTAETAFNVTYADAEPELGSIDDEIQ